MADAVPPPSPDKTPALSDSWQFSLRSALVMTGIAAVAFAVLGAVPPAVAATCLLISALVIPTAVLTIIVYGRGSARAFAIGASIPAFLLVFWLGIIFIMQFDRLTDNFQLTEDDELNGLRILIGGSWACELVCGCIGMLGRFANRSQSMN